MSSTAQFVCDYHGADFVGVYQSSIGGSIDVRSTIVGLQALGQRYGVTFLPREAVVGLNTSQPTSVTVTTTKATYTATKLVLAPGPYINQMLSLLNVQLNLTYWELTSTYFPARQVGSSFLRPSVEY